MGNGKEQKSLFVKEPGEQGREREGESPLERRPGGGVPLKRGEGEYRFDQLNAIT